MSNIANAFFRAGEHRALLGRGRLPEAAHRVRRAQRASQIESWGRGIQRIFEACRAGGAPEPELSLSGHDLWTTFPYSPEYLEAIGESSVKTSVESSVETSGKTSGKILALMRERSEITIPELAESISVTERPIERNIQKLRENGWVRRIGGHHGGHWEVLK